MKKILVAAFAAVSLVSGRADAQYNPFGPQRNVALSTITSGGWSQCYVSTMGTPIGDAAESILNACTGTKLMMAGRATGSDVILLLATGARDSITTPTGFNENYTTHSVNGSEWYFDTEWSWGFAPLGSSTYQYSCDQEDLSDEYRMCLHTEDGIGGWRIGSTAYLNDNAEFEKVFFQQDGDITVTPEPASFAMVGLGALALFGVRRRIGKK